MEKIFRFIGTLNEDPLNKITGVTYILQELLLYGSESWTLYTRQERRLNTFHLCCLRRILGISWQDHIPNNEVLARAGTLSMYALLTKRRLRWLGHVTPHARWPKTFCMASLPLGPDPQEGLHSATKTCSSGTSRWVALRQQALKRWQRTAVVGDTLPSQLSRQQRQKREEQWEEKRARRHQRAETDTAPFNDNVFICSNCNRVCRRRIGLYSHSPRCSSTTD